jgi:fatty-acid desaturase
MTTLSPPPKSPEIVSTANAIDQTGETTAATRDQWGQYEHTLRFRDIDPTVFFGIAGMHLLALAAPFFFSWSGVGIAIFLWWVVGGLGITLCFHRLLTHRSFKTSKPVEYFLTMLGTLAWQGSPIKWVGTHRIHHTHSDGEGDPHSPKHGFNWAHVLWCLRKDPPDWDPRAAAKDLQRSKVHALLDRFHFVPQFFLAAILFGAGWAVGGWWLGLSWVIWGVAVRTVFVYHVTWFVNSASHTWGYRSYETDDDSRNNWWVALLGFGEGWHNNHHAHQRAAAHGRSWWELDTTYLTIKVMEKLGLATAVVSAEPPRAKPGAQVEAKGARRP